MTALPADMWNHKGYAIRLDMAAPLPWEATRNDETVRASTYEAVLHEIEMGVFMGEDG